jgi:hypothetical protein
LKEEKSKISIWLKKMVLLLHICKVCWGWWKVQQNYAHARKGCNKCDLPRL